MASIEIYNESSTGFSAKLTGLQTDGVTYTRECVWNVSEKSTHNNIVGDTTYIEAGKTSGGDTTLSGLSPNITYDVVCIIYRTDTGAYLTTLSTDVTLSSSGGGGGGDTTDAELSIIGIGETNVSLQITNLPDSYDGSIRTIHIEAWEDPFVSNYFSPVATYDGTLENGVDSSGWILITGLDAGVRYRFACTISNIEDCDDVTLITYITTKSEDWAEGLPVVQSFYLYATGRNSDIWHYYVSIAADNWTSDSFWEIYIDGVDVVWGTDRVVDLEFDSGVFSFYDLYLDDGTHLAQLYVYNEKGTVVEDYIFETSGLNPKPSKFDWEYDELGNVSNARKKAYNALCNKGETTEFSHSVWNDIRVKVRAFFRYKHLHNTVIGPNDYGMSEYTLINDLIAEAFIKGGNYSDKTLYARKFNILRYLVDLLNPFEYGSNSIKDHYLNTGRWDFNPGERVMGSYILDLVDYINGIE